MSCNLLFIGKWQPIWIDTSQEKQDKWSINIWNRILISLTFEKMSQKILVRYFTLIGMTIIKK